MPVVLDQELYDSVKAHADCVYAKPSAYKSGYIVKTYKELGGRYSTDNKKKALKRWFAEDWQNVAKKGQYPVLRPTKRINASTPLTISEIDPKTLKKQIELKQIIRGKKNLPKFSPEKMIG